MFGNFEATFGYDPSQVYCLFTGKPIGIVNDEEFSEVLDQCADISDLRLRVLASMRPSMKWNRLVDHSLDSMRKAHPVETMAYLLAKLFEAPKGTQRTLSWDQIREERIRLFDVLATFHESMTHIPGNSWDSVVLMLLELHAKRGLEHERAPFTASDVIALSGDSLAVSLEALFRPWYDRRIDAIADAEMFANNPVARRAYVKAWMEQPAKADKPRNVERESKRSAKQAEDNFMSALFAEFTMGDFVKAPVRKASESIKSSEPEAVAKPAVPSTKVPAFLLKKREA